MTNYISAFNNKQDTFQMRSLFQFADLLDQRIDTLSYNLVIGLFLVCFVLGLFLSLRLSLWVAFEFHFHLLGCFHLEYCTE